MSSTPLLVREGHLQAGSDRSEPSTTLSVTSSATPLNRSFTVTPLNLSSLGGGSKRLAAIIGASAVAMVVLITLGAVLASYVGHEGAFLPLLKDSLKWGVPIDSVVAAPFLGALLSLWKPSDRQILQEKMEEIRIQKLRETLCLHLSGEQKGQRLPEESKQVFTRPDGSREGDSFYREVEKLQTVLMGSNIRVQDIRNQLNHLLEDPFYKAHANEDIAHVNFLQFLAIKLQCAGGQSLLEQYAEKVQEGRDCGDSLSKQIQTDRQNSPHFNRKGIQQAAWGVSNIYSSVDGPSPVRLAAIDKGVDYNAHPSNPSHFGLEFRNRNQKMQGVYGPTPVGDSIYNAVLLGYRKLGIREVYFNHQDTSKKPEQFRIQEIDEIASDRVDVLDHVIIGFEKNKEVQSWLKDDSRKDWSHYITLLRNPENRKIMGMNIPERLLSEDEISRLLDRAETYFEECVDQRRGSLSQKEIKEGIIMGVDAMIEAAIIDKVMLQRQSEDRSQMDADFQHDFIRSCCKQHVDRGVAQGSAIWIFHRAFSNQSRLTVDEKRSLMAGILGRSVMIDDRQMVESKSNRLHSFLKLIGEDDQSMQGLHGFMQDVRSRLSIRNDSMHGASSSNSFMDPEGDDIYARILTLPVETVDT